MLNAAPLLRSTLQGQQAVLAPDLVSGGGSVATIAILETTSATKTPAATARQKAEPAPPGADRAGPRAPVAQSAPLLALLAGNTQGRPGERLQARLPDRLAAGGADPVAAVIDPGQRMLR